MERGINMGTTDITTHGITEIRIVRGEKNSVLNGLVRIYGFAGNEPVMQVTLFGEEELRIPLKVSSDSSDALVIGADLFNCLGDIVEDEEE
tara:strand:+ start:1566 stop:1838 length:273 start_codon:yes stop_codon:yes gene_type:complete